MLYKNLAIFAINDLVGPEYPIYAYLELSMLSCLLVLIFWPLAHLLALILPVAEAVPEAATPLPSWQRSNKVVPPLPSRATSPQDLSYYYHRTVAVPGVDVRRGGEHISAVVGSTLGLVGGVYSYDRYWPWCSSKLSPFVVHYPSFGKTTVWISKFAKPAFMGFGAFTGGAGALMAWNWGWYPYFKNQQ